MKYKILLFLFSILFFPIYNTYSSVNEVSCSSDSNFTNSCTQCFKESSNIYLGYGTTNLSDTWNSGNIGNYIYLDENNSPVNIKSFYTNGEIEIGNGGFKWSSNLTDSNQNNGEMYQDSAGDKYLKFLPNTSGKILESKPGFFIKFANNSNNIINNGRNYPIWETQYKINYYNIGNWTKKSHIECVLNYPAWCGDGKIDSNYGEECDPNDPNKTNWNGRTCNTSCKLEGGGGGGSTPSCTELTVSNPSGVDSLTTNLSCTGENVLSYSIDCGNDTQASLTDGNGSCIYSVPGTYTPTCYVSPTVTSPSCTKTIEVIDSSNSCESIVTGTQVSEVTEVTPGLCTTGFSLAIGTFQGTTIGETTNYTWSCTDGINIFSGLSCNASYTNTDITNSCVGGITSPLNSTLTSTNPNLCTTGFTSETFDSVTNGNTTNYTWNCRDDITSELTNGGSCNASYSSGNSGGDPYQCRDITYDDGTITCEGNSQVDTFRLNCNGNQLFNSNIITNGSTTSATFSCTDTDASCDVLNRDVSESGGYAWRTTPACTLTTDTGCTGGSCLGGSSRDYCGDGIVQRPNDDGFNEQCDYGDDLIWPNWCDKSSCKIIESTQPYSGELLLSIDQGTYILGNNMPLEPNYDINPYIKNDTSVRDIYIKSLCVKKISGNTLDLDAGGDIFCQDYDEVIFPGDALYLTDNITFKGNTNSLNPGTSGDNTLNFSLKNDLKFYESAYFSKDIEVIVSKPSISTTGGGTSYVSSNTDTSNLDSDSKNFVGVGVGSSSYSDEITDTDSKNTIGYEIDDLNNNSNVGTTSYSSSNSSNLSDFESYNGIENAYIIRNKNFVINSPLFLSLSGPRTYIVESGNIIINSDIIYDDNIAFVAKGGNITIKDTVEKLKGTYIAIPNISGDYGKIRSSGETLNQLVINGALYGNSSDLVEDRTYIKYENNQISVGTIVSFGSSVFRDPAPLVSTFVSDYQKSAKTAK